MIYLTVKEVAQRLKVSTGKVRGWLTSGELRPINVSAKRGGKKPRYRVSEDELARFEVAREIVPASRTPRRKSIVKRLYT